VGDGGDVPIACLLDEHGTPGGGPREVGGLRATTAASAEPVLLRDLGVGTVRSASVRLGGHALGILASVAADLPAANRPRVAAAMAKPRGSMRSLVGAHGRLSLLTRLT
jgi:hypothetical protein